MADSHPQSEPTVIRDKRRIDPETGELRGEVPAEEATGVDDTTQPGSSPSSRRSRTRCPPSWRPCRRWPTAGSRTCSA